MTLWRAARRAYGVTITHIGTGTSDPGEGTTYVTAGQSLAIDFGTKGPHGVV